MPQTTVDKQSRRVYLLFYDLEIMTSAQIVSLSFDQQFEQLLLECFQTIQSWSDKEMSILKHERLITCCATALMFFT